MQTANVLFGVRMCHGLARAVMLILFVHVGVISCSTAMARTANLLVNGDFEAGNTGFYTELRPNMVSWGSYFVVTDPKQKHARLASIGDHTTGTGRMMVIDGTGSRVTVVWGQDVAVVPESTYEFIGWMASLYRAVPASVQLRINGRNVGDETISGGLGVWRSISAVWPSGSETTATIELIETSTGLYGNDYALDDFEFSGRVAEVPGSIDAVAPVPLPASGGALALALVLLSRSMRRGASIPG